MTYSRKECTEALQEATELLGKSPTQDEYINLDISPSHTTISRIFGSWNKAKEAADLETINRREYSKQECIDSLRRAAELLGKSPSHDRFNELDLKPSANHINDVFDSWANAKEEAGLQRGDIKPVNTEFFRKPLTNEAAYWLGMLWGDGGITKRGEEKYEMSFGLSEKDAGHVRAFKNAIESEHSLVNSGGNECVRIYISRGDFLQPLLDYGFKPGKTTSSSLPPLSEPSKRRDFIRGLNDADGYVEKTGVQIAGVSKKRFEKLENWIPYKTSIYKYCREDRQNIFTLVTMSSDYEEVINWMYPNGHDTSPALARKLQAALD
jgi:hypothetical protein